MNLHNLIMDIAEGRPDSSFESTHDRLLYKEGHRDARHAAAELALQAERDRIDAERYRWLRAQPCNISDTPRIDVVYWTCEGDDSVNEGEGLRMEALDAAIDAAIEKGN